MIETATDIYWWITANRDWIFSGIGLMLLGYLFRLLGFKPFNSSAESRQDNRSVQNNTNTTNITITGNSTTDTSSGNEGTCKHTLEERKSLTKILFIDDDTSYKVVPILKRSGWKNTKIKKGVKNADDKDIDWADICFVDINGVATEMFEKDQGLGLMGSIKDKYKGSKKVIVYSSQEQRDVFNELWDKADARLPKNAEPYQFQNLLDIFSKELYC